MVTARTETTHDSAAGSAAGIEVFQQVTEKLTTREIAAVGEVDDDTKRYLDLINLFLSSSNSHSSEADKLASLFRENKRLFNWLYQAYTFAFFHQQSIRKDDLDHSVFKYVDENMKSFLGHVLVLCVREKVKKNNSVFSQYFVTLVKLYGEVLLVGETANTQELNKAIMVMFDYLTDTPKPSLMVITRSELAASV